jgi:DNA-binding winged helix-turn-helix (wHTH) protein
MISMVHRRYRFAGFTVSPARRTLQRSGEEIPLIPRYFDLLLLLLERRNEAVSRRVILDVVWHDVVVSDGALSQAVRTLRRALGDASRDPRFIRTHARHGYQFVYSDVVDEPDVGMPPPAARVAEARSETKETADEIDTTLERLLEASSEDEWREAAERLHALGTSAALERLDRRPGHETARAILRETRWDVAGAGAVPLLGQPGGAAAFRKLVALRLSRAARFVRRRWLAASWGGALAGGAAGAIGGAVLLLSAQTSGRGSLPLALAIFGGAIGWLGAAGVGAGLAVAEALARSMRGIALVVCGSLGGGMTGLIGHLVGRRTVENLFGHDLSAVGGGLEGLGVGAVVGLGYALSTPRPGGGGMATPKGASRLLAAAITGLCCAAGFVALSAAGANFGGGSLEVLARSFHGSQVGLAPIARLLGETEVGPLTRAVISALEGLFFGSGITLGLTHRPR